MKKKDLISLLCAGVLTVGAITGLTGFTGTDDKDSVKIPSTAEAMSAGSSSSDAEAEADDSYTFLTTSGTVGDVEIGSDEKENTVADVAAAVLPAVVSITNKSVQEVQNLFGMYGMYGYGNGRSYTYESESCGSGIIIGQNDEELLICTNYHVIDDATELTVGFVDDEVCEAVLKGGDESNDLAVVSVKLEDIPDDTLSQIRIAEIGSSDDLVIGEQVVAIGNALGYGQSVTTGIVSALNRQIDLDGYNIDLIQTDAAINPGNSGGALLDMNGRIIGINSAKASSSGVEGMGYAIPISYARSILEDLMNKQTRTEVVDEEDSSYVGIAGQDVTSDMASVYGIPEGIYVTEVAEGSPAEEAGLQKGDIIVKFDSDSISSMSGLKSLLQYYAAGEEVKITISRADDGEYTEQDLTITLGSLAEYQSNQ